MGIKVTNPGYRLDIGNITSLSNNGLRLYTGSAAYTAAEGTITLEPYSDQSRPRLTMNSDNGTEINSLNTSGAFGTKLLLQRLGGNVGIGLLSPTALLHISTTTPGMDVFKVTAGSNTVVVNSSGNVGIGNLTPAATLDTNGTIRATGVGIGGTGTGVELAFTGGNGFLQSYNRSTSAYQTLKIEGSTLLLNTSSGGNVGIGTTSPGSLLSVAGNGYFTGTLNASNFKTNVGTENTTIGVLAGNASISGGQNTIVGYQAGNSLTSGSNNGFFGYGAGALTTTGNFNFFSGRDAGRSNTTGISNINIGYSAGYSATSSSQNIIIGDNAGYDNTASNVVFLGNNSGRFNTTGTDNTFLGISSGQANTTGSQLTFIGRNAGLTSTASGLTNATAIGYNAQVTASNSLILGNGANVGIGTTSPYAKLAVVGQVVADSIYVTSTTANNYFAGNVGIGTTTPNGLLNIAGATPKLTLTNTSGGTNLKHWFIQSNAGKLRFATTSDALVDTTLAPLTITSAGNIGINNESAPNLLTIKTTKYVDTQSLMMYTSDGTGYGSGTGSLRLNPAASSGLGEFVFDNDAGFRYQAYNAAGSDLYGQLQFDTNGIVITNNVTNRKQLVVKGTVGQTADIFQVASSTGTAFLNVTSAGNVGIGTTSPASKLTVTGSACISAGAGATAACTTTAGHISAVSFDTANVDLAENYQTTDQTIAAGDIVAIDPDHDEGIVKAHSTGSGQSPAVIGIVSTQPGMLLGANEKNTTLRPVALAGRVPVKFSSENGSIKRGDNLTLSSQAGVAMKWTPSLAREGAGGVVIGTALTEVSTNSMVTVFIRPSMSSIGFNNFNATSTNNSTDESGFVTTFTNLLSGTEQWMSTKLTASVGFFKNVFAHEVHTDKLCVGNTCLTEDRVKVLMQNNGMNAAVSTQIIAPASVPGSNSVASSSVTSTSSPQVQQTSPATMTESVSSPTATSTPAVVPETASSTPAVPLPAEPAPATASTTPA